MLANLFRTKYLGKYYSNTNSNKKGDVKDQNRENYDSISLLSVVHKLSTIVFTYSISATLDSNQLKEQTGFRIGYSTTNHIHVIYQVVEKNAEYTKFLCMTFIDYEKKAFYSVEISAAMKTLRKH